MTESPPWWTSGPGAPPRIRLVVALPAEARPLVSHLGLEREPSAGSFATYRRDDAVLVVSGVGKRAAQAATGHLFARTGEVRDALWLNLGIAGHATRGLGEVVLAHKVVDAASGRCWYPPWVLDPPCATGEVRTVEAVEESYAEDALYEMESAGFFAAASRFATAELVQAVKVVSDNRRCGTAGITARRVEALIEASLPVVDRLLSSGAALARELAARSVQPGAYRELLAGLHFTVTQRR